MSEPVCASYVVLIAGLPHWLESILAAKLKKFKSGKYKLEIVYTKKQIYSEDYFTLLYGRLASSVSKHVLGKKDGQHLRNLKGAYAIFVNLTPDRRARAIASLGLEVPILTADVKFSSSDRRTPNELGALANHAEAEIRKRLKQGEDLLKALTKELKSNDNQTPFLLPRKNFGAGEVDRMVSCVQATVIQGSPAKAVVGARNSIVARLSRVTIRGSQKRHFKNAKGLVFQSPGSNRHGIPGCGSNGCNEKCWTRGHVRFGVFYDTGFHYDCVKEKGDLQHSWSGCHEQRISVKKGRKHVNIAPNDFVR